MEAFKRLFVKPSNEVPSQPAQTATTAPAKTTASLNPVSTVNPDMVEVLQKKIKSRVTPYTTLLENAAILEDVIADPTTRLKAAYKQVAKDGSRTVSSIVQAIDLHLTDIEGERSRFQQRSQVQMRQTSGALREQAAALEAQNAANAAKVLELQAELERLSQESQQNANKVSELNSQADAAEADIVATAQQFDNAADFVKADLLQSKASLTAALS